MERFTAAFPAAQVTLHTGAGWTRTQTFLGLLDTGSGVALIPEAASHDVRGVRRCSSGVCEALVIQGARDRDKFAVS